MNSTAFIESTVKSTLDNLDIDYEWIEVDPDFADTASFCKKYGFGLDKSGNTIILASKRGEKKYSACIVLGTDRLDVNKTVRNLMGVSRLSFANADETMHLTGMMIGGVTPFGLPKSPLGGIVPQKSPKGVLRPLLDPSLQHLKHAISIIFSIIGVIFSSRTSFWALELPVGGLSARVIL